MTENEYSPTDALVGRVKEHYDAKEATASHVETVAENSGKKVRGRPFEKGVSGNPGGRPNTRNVVEFIRDNTNNYEDILGFMVKVATGRDIPGHKPTLRERMDASNALLDRSIGKPIQAVVEADDEHGKEVLANLQALLHVKETEASTEGEPVEMPGNVSAIDQMRSKPPKNT